MKAGAKFIVPPARLESIVHHELTHCFLQGPLPDWLNEGACTYVAADRQIIVSDLVATLPHVQPLLTIDAGRINRIAAANEQTFA